MPMRVMMIGSSGQLGSDIVDAFGRDPRFSVTGFDHAQVELCSRDSLAAAVRACRPDVVVNTAAFHLLDRCEEEPERAFAVNCTALSGLCSVCFDVGAILVHFSTDYVFGGEKRTPYRESDAPWPVNVYGISKLAGEHVIRASLERHYILRVSGLYGKRGPRGKGLNFPDLMVKLARERGELKVVEDQVTTPTSTACVARRLPEIFDRVPFGLYHFSDEGHCSWYEFARKILELTGITARIEPVRAGHFGEKTRRPAYSVLSKETIGRSMDPFPAWEGALREYLRIGERA